MAGGQARSLGFKVLSLYNSCMGMYGWTVMNVLISGGVLVLELAAKFGIGVLAVEHFLRYSDADS